MVMGLLPNFALMGRLQGKIMPFTAFDETGIVGFFTLRNPDESLDELRFGFVIVTPHKRGKGYGKAMLEPGIKFAFEIYGAKKVSLVSARRRKEAMWFHR